MTESERELDLLIAQINSERILDSRKLLQLEEQNLALREEMTRLKEGWKAKLDVLHKDNQYLITLLRTTRKDIESKLYDDKDHSNNRYHSGS